MRDALAQRQVWRHEYLGTEHILHGLMATRDEIAGKLLSDLDIDRAACQKALASLTQNGPDLVPMQLSLVTQRAILVVEHAIDEAMRLDNRSVGAEHLLAGTLLEREGVAAQVLMNQGLRIKHVRACFPTGLE